MLTHKNISGILLSTGIDLDITLEIEEKVSKLIRKCNARGGTDNISVAYLYKG